MNQQQDPGAIATDRREVDARQTGGTTGPNSGDMPTGPGGQGSFGTRAYNDRGNLTGPDSPAGSDASHDATGEGQGDDLVNRLGGERTEAGLSGAGAATGDTSAGRSEPAEAAEPIAPDAGSPGGMGGVHAQGGTGTDRPAGGVSPVQDREGD